MSAHPTEQTHPLVRKYLLVQFEIDAGRVIPFQDSIFKIKRRLQLGINLSSIDLLCSAYQLAGGDGGSPNAVSIKHLWMASEGNIECLSDMIKQEISRINGDQEPKPIKATFTTYDDFAFRPPEPHVSPNISTSELPSACSVLYLAADDGNIYKLPLSGEPMRSRQTAEHIKMTANHLASQGIRIASIPGGSIPTRGTLCYLVNIRNISGVSLP